MKESSYLGQNCSHANGQSLSVINHFENQREI